MPIGSCGTCSLPAAAHSGDHKRLRAAAGLLGHAIGAVATDTSRWTDDLWIVDSTPVECGRSRETTKRSALAGWAHYRCCASHWRSLWGLRLQLVCTLHGLPVAFALTSAKADQRQVLVDLLGVEPELVPPERPRRCWPTTTPTTASSRRSLARWGCGCCGRLARASPSDLAQACSSRCGS